MSDDLRVALITSLQDRLVGPLRRSLDEVEKTLKKTERDLTGVTKASRETDRALSGMRGPLEAARQAALLARNTANALGLAERLASAWNRTGSMMKGLGGAVAAGQAIRYVTSEPLRTERSYGRSLADAANVAFADRDLAGRQAGVRELDSIVVDAMRKGGGQRPAVLGALNEMLASGTVSVDQARSVLPITARYATAGGADIGDLSGIVVRALQNGFKEADIPRILDMALAAGQAGGFELKDMARWLPKLLAAGQMSGLGGMEGYARILASAQGSVVTAGSKDEAGNNLLNLLLKINASDTAMDAKKLGIDLAGSLAAARGKGTNSLDAFVNLTDQIASRDQRMVALRKQAASAGSDSERKASLSAQADILQGSAIGKIVQDRQALLALVAELNKREYIQGVQRTVNSARGQFGEANFGLVSSTNDFKLAQQDNEKLIAQTDVLGTVNSALGKLAEGMTDLYRRHPEFASALEASKLAVWSLTAAAGSAAGALALMGLAKGGAGLVGGLGAGAVAGAAGRVAATAAPGWMVGTGVTSVPAAAAAAGGGALAAGVGGGVAVASGLVLGAGVLASEAMNSEGGLRARINSRQARIRELGELASLEQAPGGSPVSLAKIQRDLQALIADRDNLLAKTVDQGDVVREIRALANRPIQVMLDGRDIQASTNSANAADARRR